VANKAHQPIAGSES